MLIGLLRQSRRRHHLARIYFSSILHYIPPSHLFRAMMSQWRHSTESQPPPTTSHVHRTPTLIGRRLDFPSVTWLALIAAICSSWNSATAIYVTFRRLLQQKIQPLLMVNQQCCPILSLCLCCLLIHRFWRNSKVMHFPRLSSSTSRFVRFLVNGKQIYLHRR